MKTLLSTILLALSTQLISAQTNVYQPYALDNASWTIYTQLYNGQTYIQDWYTIAWVGDTTINGETYTRVFDNPNMIGVRQDIPNEKIYYIDDQGVEYDASFDQSAMPGDTVLMTEAFEILSTFSGGSAMGDFTAVVESVDSILLGSTYHKRMYFTSAGTLYNPFYICGVGFQSATTSISSSFDIACYYVDGYQLIGDPFNPECTASTEELLEQNFNVYPNPTSGHFFIESNHQSELQEIYLLDITGKRLAQFDTKNIENGYDISSLPSGMYFVEMIHKKGKVRSTLIR